MNPERDIAAFLHLHRLAGQHESLQFHALAGGVSSDIWCVTTATRKICVKRALARLRVSAVWEAPTSRNASEWEWLALVSRMLPNTVPALYAHDRAAGMFAMEFLEPETYPVWKEQLRDGVVDLETAACVGDHLGQIHANTASDAVVAESFANDATFFSLRLEPYLLHTANVHPDLRVELEGIARTTAESKRALVHGDVSPKNVLVGPNGPIFVDAECAWFGDPAFDLAFVLNHLLLKSIWRPQHAAAYAAAFRALASAYRTHIAWETVAAFEIRCARLLPALTLARVDGKSPAEYLTEWRDRDKVRQWARALVRSAPESLNELLDAWLHHDERSVTHP